MKEIFDIADMTDAECSRYDIYKCRDGKYYFVFDDKKQRYQQSRIELTPIDGEWNTYIQIFGSTDGEVDEWRTKRKIISELKNLIYFKRYIAVLTENDRSVRFQLHCRLKELPNKEELKSIYDICRRYEMK